MAYRPSGISLTRMPIPISGRAMEAVKELKRQDMNSYLYLLMEDTLAVTVEGFRKEQGDGGSCGRVSGRILRKGNGEQVVNSSMAEKDKMR